LIQEAAREEGEENVTETQDLEAEAELPLEVLMARYGYVAGGGNDAAPDSPTGGKVGGGSEPGVASPGASASPAGGRSLNAAVEPASISKANGHAGMTDLMRLLVDPRANTQNTFVEFWRMDFVWKGWPTESEAWREVVDGEKGGGEGGGLES